MNLIYSLEAVNTLSGNETTVWAVQNLAVGVQDLLAGTGAALPAGNPQPPSPPRRTQGPPIEEILEALESLFSEE